MIKIEGICQYEGCVKPATAIAVGRDYQSYILDGNLVSAGRGHQLGCYCKEHANRVAAEDMPEYVADCPNCGCKFGIK